MLMLMLVPATAGADGQISLTSSGQLDYSSSCGRFYSLPLLPELCSPRDTRSVTVCGGDGGWGCRLMLNPLAPLLLFSPSLHPFSPHFFICVYLFCSFVKWHVAAFPSTANIRRPPLPQLIGHDDLSCRVHVYLLYKFGRRLSELNFSKSLGGCGGANRDCDKATTATIVAATFAPVQQEAAYCLLLPFYLVGPTSCLCLNGRH